MEDIPLTKEMAGEGLSLLAKTGSGLAHAYVRMDLRDKWVNVAGVKLQSHDFNPKLCGSHDPSPTLNLPDS